MAGDVATSIGFGHTGFPAEIRDEAHIQVPLSDLLPTKHEEVIDDLARFRIETCWLNRTRLLPCFNSFSNDPIHCFRKSGTRFVDRDIEPADCLLCERLLCFCDGDICLLPAHTSSSESPKFIRAESGEEPGDRHGTNHLYRVGSTCLRKILCGEV